MVKPSYPRPRPPGTKVLSHPPSIVNDRKVRPNRVQAGSTATLNRPTGGNTSSSGGGVAAPPAPVLPPVLQAFLASAAGQDLIKKGLLSSTMTPEQIMAVMGISSSMGQTPIDIKELLDQLRGTYSDITGNTQADAMDFMRQMMGANVPTDPQMAALFAQDPLFSGYAGSLEQMQETAGQNEASDEAWFLKQQQALSDYYNGLLLANATGTLLPPADVPTGGGGGGGGGGGHGYGGGGGGYSGGGGSGDLGFGHPRTQITENRSLQETATDNWARHYPDYVESVMQTFGGNPEILSLAMDILDSGDTPQDIQRNLHQLYLDAVATTKRGETISAQNEAVTSGLSASVANQLSKANLAKYGIVLGDNPATPDITESAYADPTAQIPDSVLGAPGFGQEQNALLQLADIALKGPGSPSSQATLGNYAMAGPEGTGLTKGEQQARLLNYALTGPDPNNPGVFSGAALPNVPLGTVDMGAVAQPTGGNTPVADLAQQSDAQQEFIRNARNNSPFGDLISRAEDRGFSQQWLADAIRSRLGLPMTPTGTTAPVTPFDTTQTPTPQPTSTPQPIPPYIPGGITTGQPQPEVGPNGTFIQDGNYVGTANDPAMQTTNPLANNDRIVGRLGNLFDYLNQRQASGMTDQQMASVLPQNPPPGPPMAPAPTAPQIQDILNQTPGRGGSVNIPGGTVIMTPNGPQMLLPGQTVNNPTGVPTSAPPSEAASALPQLPRLASEVNAGMTPQQQLDYENLMYNPTAEMLNGIFGTAPADTTTPNIDSTVPTNTNPADLPSNAPVNAEPQSFKGKPFDTFNTAALMARAAERIAERTQDESIPDWRQKLLSVFGIDTGDERPITPEDLQTLYTARVRAGDIDYNPDAITALQRWSQRFAYPAAVAQAGGNTDFVDPTEYYQTPVDPATLRDAAITQYINKFMTPLNREYNQLYNNVLYGSRLTDTSKQGTTESARLTSYTDPGFEAVAGYAPEDLNTAEDVQLGVPSEEPGTELGPSGYQKLRPSAGKKGMSDLTRSLIDRINQPKPAEPKPVEQTRAPTPGSTKPGPKVYNRPTPTYTGRGAPKVVNRPVVVHPPTIVHDEKKRRKTKV